MTMTLCALERAAIEPHLQAAMNSFYDVALQALLREMIYAQPDPATSLNNLIAGWKELMREQWRVMKQMAVERTGIIQGDTSPAENAILEIAESIIRRTFDPSRLETAVPDEPAQRLSPIVS